MDDFGNDLGVQTNWSWVQYNSWFVSTATYGGFCDWVDNAII